MSTSGHSPVPEPAPDPTQAPGAEPDAAPPSARLSHRWAVALVFGSSAAVLVVEIVALRLLAPHLGLTLETSTLVIGIALSAIALGSWAGGRIADAVDPRRLIGPVLGVSGAVVAFTPASLRFVADTAPGLLLPAASLTILIPGSLLSAVTPMVTKLRLHSLQQTGTVVGQLSGASTLGAILGTVLTGLRVDFPAARQRDLGQPRGATRSRFPPLGVGHPIGARNRSPGARGGYRWASRGGRPGWL